MSRLAIYPGTFDPVTVGHLDLIKRAHCVFDELIVAVAKDTPKATLFDIDERLDLLRKSTAGMAGIRIESFEGLVIKFAKEQGANVLVRGLRMISDFEYEMQMALTNRHLDESIETMFLMPAENYTFLSSTLLKQAARLGADVSAFVPKPVVSRLKERLGSKV